MDGYISKIALPDSSVYDIKDNAARESIEKKVFIDDRISGIQEYSDLSIIKLSAQEYDQLVTDDQVISNGLYIVEDDFEDAYGQQIKNMAPGTDLSDAVNLEQLSNALSDVVIPTDLSAFTNSPGYTTNTGTITGITMNGASKGTSGNVNLGTVLTAHQSLSNCLQNNSSYDGINLTATSPCTFDFPHINLPDTSILFGDFNSESLYASRHRIEFKELDVEGGYSSVQITTSPDIQIACVVGIGPEPPKTPSELMSEIKFTGGTNNSPVTSSLADLVYQKSETSSAAEISGALSAKADLSSIEHVVQYEQDYNGNYTAATIGSRRSSLSTDIGPNSFVNGYNCQANDCSHAEGCETYANNFNAHAEGSYTSAFGVTSHAEGFGTIADNDGAHAEGGYTSAFGYYSHTEGGWTSTGTNAIGAHAEGGFTRADGPISHVEGVKATAEISDYQSFVWQGTDVMPNELTDITPSTWDEYKAHGPGTFNINPVSGAAGVYIGEQTLASMLGGGIESIEWAELVTLAQTSALNPGTKYRITDYVTMVDQADCRSAEHPFDLIVTAIDNHTLDEHAIATLPSNGDDYFAAREFHIPDYQQYLEYARVPLESWEIKYCLDNDKMRFKFADVENGKGIIYYMRDEFGNEAPYDFKNVQFKRYKITSSPRATNLEGMYGLAVGGIEVDTSDELWCYTFNGADYEDFGFSEPYDFSGWHVRPTQAVLQQFGGPSVERLQECAGNVILAKQQDATDFSLMSFKLPNNVFHCALTDTPVSELPFLKIGYCSGNRLGLNCDSNTFGDSCNSNTFGYNCNSNTFGYNCDSNTFGYNCNSNTFGDNCDSNTFGNSCYGNTFGDDCDSNTFGDNCDSNTFGNSCYGNTFGDSCDSNTFGDDCDSNTFGDNCDSNTFGNSCYGNTFGDSCYGNTFGDSCDSNTFGDNCDSNTFGNSCYGNTFGDSCDSNTFGNDCTYIKFASTSTSNPSEANSYYEFITVDSGNQYIVLNCTQSTYGGNEYKNVHILPGVNNTSSYKTIIDSNVNQSFCTTYQPANSQVIAI